MYKDKKIGVGIITYNRVNNFKLLLSEIKAIDYIDEVIVIKNKNVDYGNVDYSGIEYVNILEDIGVAVCKNTALKYLINKGCEHLFLVEDDMLIKNYDVFKKYIDTAQIFNLEHLNFGSAWNSTQNAQMTRKKVVQIQGHDIAVDLYKRLCGCFSYFTKNVIEKCGFFDEKYINSIEHIDHTLKISMAGYYTPFHWFADIHDSPNYLEYTIEGRVSTVNDDKVLWKNRFIQNMKYFDSKHPFSLASLPTATEQQVLNFLQKQIQQHSVKNTDNKDVQKQQMGDK